MSLLVIDAPCLAHIAKHAMKGLSHGDKETNVIYGFLRQLCDILLLFPNHKPVFTWDSRKSYRREVYPDYKRSRIVTNKTPEEIVEDEAAYAQFADLRMSVLPALGFKNVFIKTGFESDDIIASIILAEKDPANIVVSMDDDLLQLLEHCSIYNPRTKKIKTREEFEKEYRIEPKQWATVKSIAGCSTDCVEGVRGVGELTAIKYLKSELKTTSKALQSITSDEGKQITARNKSLVTLPYSGTGTFSIQNHEIYSVTAFMDVCSKYGLASFLKEPGIIKWQKALFHREN